MKQTTLIFLMCLLVVLVYSCKIGTDPNHSLGQYSYSAYDSSGQEISSGSLTLSLKDSTRIEGSWQLKKTSDCNYCGDQAGNGLIKGFMRGDSISLDIHPGWADNNVLLNGKVEPGRITGQWSWVSFAGISGKGTFKATEK